MKTNDLIPDIPVITEEMLEHWALGLQQFAVRVREKDPRAPSSEVVMLMNLANSLDRAAQDLVDFVDGTKKPRKRCL